MSMSLPDPSDQPGNASILAKSANSDSSSTAQQLATSHLQLQSQPQHHQQHVSQAIETPSHVSSATTRGSRQNATSSKPQSQLAQRLQISERDSIFAENYHHDSSPEDVTADGQSLESVVKKKVAPVLPDSRVTQTKRKHMQLPETQGQRPNMAASPLLAAEPSSRLPSRVDSPASKEPFDLYLFRSDRSSRLRDRSNSSHSPASRPATPQRLLSQQRLSPSLLPSHPQSPRSNSLSDHIIALPPLASPSDTPRSRPSTPRALTFGNSGSKIAHSTDERVRYNSWRQGLPVLGGRVTMGDYDEDAEGSVDKKIEATLPRAEQSTIARSRKSSHMLRIFDKSGEGDESKKEDKVRHASSEAVERGRRGTVNGRTSSRQPSPVLEETERDIKIEKAKDSKGKTVVRVQDTPATSHTDWTKRLSQVDSRSYTSTQQQDLEEDEARISTSPENALSRQNTITASESAHEQLQKEHVVSAVYYPHRTPDQQAAERLRSPSKARPSTSRDVATDVGKDVRQDEDDRGIELSLQSEDESHYLHGDLPELTRVTSKESEDHRFLSEGAVSGTESEWEMSEDEHHEPDQLSKPRSASDHASQPLPSAIELKPFSHQVGGHAAVYRVSRKAICKKVNNRENKFYETVERYHPDFLSYMPR